MLVDDAARGSRSLTYAASPSGRAALPAASGPRVAASERVLVRLPNCLE
jgi:hypothetical protein